jgi:hypothetical protein
LRTEALFLYTKISAARERESLLQLYSWASKKKSRPFYTVEHSCQPRLPSFSTSHLFLLLRTRAHSHTKVLAPLEHGEAGSAWLRLFVAQFSNRLVDAEVESSSKLNLRAKLLKNYFTLRYEKISCFIKNFREFFLI